MRTYWLFFQFNYWINTLFLPFPVLIISKMWSWFPAFFSSSIFFSCHTFLSQSHNRLLNARCVSITMLCLEGYLQNHRENNYVKRQLHLESGNPIVSILSHALCCHERHCVKNSVAKCEREFITMKKIPFGNLNTWQKHLSIKSALLGLPPANYNCFHHDNTDCLILW